MSRIVGISGAKAMILTGESVSAEEAAQMGIIYKVVPSENLIDSAMEITVVYGSC